MEERLSVLEKGLSEHTRMNLDLRRELFAKFGELSEQTRATEKQLANAETVVEGKVASIDGQLPEMRVYIAAAEARLPLDGALVKQGFEKIDKEIDLLKRNAHEASGAGITLAIPTLKELERMRRRIVVYERSTDALANNGSHLQMMVESLAAAVAAQDGRVGGLEQHTAQLQFFIEAMRVG